MRSAGLAKLLRGVMASVVPIVSLNGCVGEECYGDDEQHQKYLTVRENGQIIELSDNPPNLPDASVGEDGGNPDDGDAGGGIDCTRACYGVVNGGDCGQSGTVLGCRSLGRADGRFFASCDIQFKPVCMPAGVQCGRRTAGLWIESIGGERQRRDRGGRCSGRDGSIGSRIRRGVPRPRARARSARCPPEAMPRRASCRGRRNAPRVHHARAGSPARCDCPQGPNESARPTIASANRRRELRGGVRA